ncbi:MAG: elongation factor P [Deltaproteobacteria bacterium]|nr:elongation factor P [Deltaproteobacteria bacterium]
MYNTQDFRNGLKILWEGEPYIIVEFQHVKPGKGNAFTRTKIKNLLTGRVLEPTLKSGEKVGVPDIEEKEMQYAYRDGDHYSFMDTQTYDQVLIDKEALAEAEKWLLESTVCSILFWNGKAIAVTPPTFVVMKITSCEPGVRGDTATNATKPATMESGAVVNVPLFINEGESIKIDTRTGSYVERA